MSAENPAALVAGMVVAVRTALDEWKPARTLTGVEGTHDADGHKIHDFPVVWVTTDGDNRIPWPVEDVQRVEKA